MKQLYTFFFISLFPLILLFTTTLHAQSLTGIWRGYFISESNDQYKFELQLEQKNNSISGVSYSYLTTVFYGKATLTGIYNKASRNALIQEIKTVELRMSSGSSACIMKCSFSYFKSGNEEFLEGTFNSFFEKADSVHDRKKGEDCGSGTVYLRRVPTSDFYVEPFLRNYAKKGLIKTQPPQTNTTTPVTSMKIPSTEKKTVRTTNNPDISKNKIPAAKQSGDSVVKTEPSQINAEMPRISLNTPDVLNTRSNELVKTLSLGDPDVTIKIYDNGEIDDDTVSVYLDKKLVLSQKRLSASPLILKLKMDTENPEHEMVMVADNLGRIPPNTSLMIVEAGEKRYDVRITSTEQKNAVIRFIYKKQN